MFVLLLVMSALCFSHLSRERLLAPPFSPFFPKKPILVRAERGDLQCSLSQALFSLPPKCRSIVGLHCFRQLSFAEIARVLNIPRNTVKTYYYRSLPRLRSALMSNVHLVSVS